MFTSWRMRSDVTVVDVWVESKSLMFWRWWLSTKDNFRRWNWESCDVSALLVDCEVVGLSSPCVRCRRLNGDRVIDCCRPCRGILVSDCKSYWSCWNVLNRESESEMRGGEYEFKDGKCWYWYKEIKFWCYRMVCNGMSLHDVGVRIFG